MKIKFRHTLLLSCFLVLGAVNITGQNNTALVLDKNVKSHKEIDSRYAQFTSAYEKLAIDAVADLYTVDADYLPAGGKPLKGRAEIRESFAQFFNSIKERGQTMSISFQILQREVTGQMGYDVGVYTLTTFKDGKQIGQGRGQFVVVTKKVGKKWFFQLDTYSNLPPAKEEKK